MAVSKDTRSSPDEANPLFLELFRASKVSADREQAWRDAVRFAATGVPTLRFPVYEHLYQLNVCAQRMVELLEELGSKFSINPEHMLHFEALIQYVRASASQDVVDFMSGIELTEGWLFEGQRRKEEARLRDPDDVDVSVRQSELSRTRQNVSARTRSQDELPDTKKSTAKKAKTGKAS
jgi:C4-dicarboxylate-specific signal transduction histidine kinase